MKAKMLILYKMIRATVFLLLLASCLACASLRGKGGGSSGEDVDGLVYLPGGEGFGYKSTNLSSDHFLKWAFANKDILRETILSLPDGYILQVVGHSDSSGPRRARGRRKGNVWYSTQRARAAYKALLRYRFPAGKLGYIGIADSQPLIPSDPRSPKNRRISFRVVAKR